MQTPLVQRAFPLPPRCYFSLFSCLLLYKYGLSSLSKMSDIDDFSSVPYELPLQVGIIPRLLITIVGESKQENPVRFHVDFVKGNDRAFHFNPRFNERTIICNSFLDNRWGNEERCSVFPFLPGQRFEIQIVCEQDCFKVTVNGTYLLEYMYRIKNLKEITKVHIAGDISLFHVMPSMMP
ncbi:galectin-3 isoform X2 [Latimeria chalumnae]|uniref:galectin-3 isoform X2 n=1 Tax=Latimeria chalumnae TaxID=7897 RepID=UPI0006D8F4C9|nr:PREDICTED: galectin-3-like isoform X2 [Latimeria chalumnae]|eukprot:XP_014341168.1 PREDICTED: galectin-3-like isoform X2 [Latimeria chalumnae]